MKALKPIIETVEPDKYGRTVKSRNSGWVLLDFLTGDVY